MKPKPIRRGRAPQEGFAALLLVFLAALMAFFFVIGPMFIKYLEQIDAAETNESTYLDDVSAKLVELYSQNAGAIDQNVTYSPDPNDIWASLNVQPKAGMRLAVSTRLTGNQVQYRRFVVWLQRANPDTSAFDPATGTFTPGTGVPFRVIDGEPIQGKKYEITLQRMQMFASMLQKRFQTKFEADPLRTLTINHFRPISGTCTTTTDDIPCIDTYANVMTAASWTSLLSQDPAAWTSAWGQPFTVSNLQDSNTLNPPFTMAIRTALPWSGSVLVSAIQPLN